MKTGYFFGLILIVISGFFSAVLAQEDTVAAQLPDGETVLNNYIQATGGRTAYDAVQNRVTEWMMEIPAQGFSLTCKAYLSRPNRAYMIMESPAFGKIEKGIDGDVAWENTLMKGPRLLEGQEKADILREAVMDKYVEWKKFYSTITCAGVDTIEGKACYRCELMPIDGKPQTFYFDVDTFLLHKVEVTAETDMGAIPVESYISDYRRVDQLLVPFKTMVKVLGQERVITTQSIAHNQPLADDFFTPPAEVRALLDKNK
ncbi:hypothetical protein JXO59_09475 [candidate division KSB1 bacterium]|nr:hypothetical protein [candidate division KSB1 bacterium]